MANYRTPYEMMALQLQLARERAGKTQKDAADYLGCTYQAISNWERSKAKIDSLSLLKLLAYYGVDIYEFMELSGIDEMRRINASTPEMCESLYTAYAKADPGTQAAVRKLLDLDDAGAAVVSPPAALA